MRRSHHYFLLVATNILMFLVSWLFLPPVQVQGQTALKVIIHHVEARAIQGAPTYEVHVIFTILDDQGKPVQGIALENLTLLEDSQKASIDTLQSAQDSPVSVILLLDTSGSMSGPKIDEAKLAAQTFLSRLGDSDRVALVTFNESITRLSEFDSAEVVSSKVDQVTTMRNSGTCLYDAVYDALELAATVPTGRRAIILLTDGVDEKFQPQGERCSTHVLDDITNKASEEKFALPIYTIGLGEKGKIDEQSLQRMAVLTGGQYQVTPKETELSSLFANLSDLLKSELELVYTSSNAPGAHVITLQANVSGNIDETFKQFSLPPLSTMVNIISPVDGQSLQGTVKILSSIPGGGEKIEKVVFALDDSEIGSDDTTPYELDWDSSQSPPGIHALTVTAYGAENKILDQKSISVQVVSIAEVTPTVPPTALPTATNVPPTSTPPATPEITKQPSSTGFIVGGVILFLIALATVLVFFFVVRPRLRQTASDYEIEEILPADGATLDEITGSKPGSATIGTLTVLYSDDAMMINSVLNINKDVTTIGKAADNDMIFSKDTPVSRHHVILRREGGWVKIFEAVTMENGRPRYPTYGTYVNDEPLTRQGKTLQEGRLLHSGDTIRLGNRLKLRFQSFLRADETFEDLQSPKYDEDQTLDDSTADEQLKNFKNLSGTHKNPAKSDKAGENSPTGGADDV